ncbi:tRNA uracil 4-sulfurtransferase ThiI [Methanoregula sp.]|uniref:tRNA uracil 4-sulfurtransferase ThiI n=1 Tax=Methanoregula sp. TaxID=2052170 RepID=UPI003C759157
MTADPSTGTGISGNPVMVRYGELFLKSEPVRHHFISMLLRNIRHALAANGLSARFETPRGRILIFGEEPGQIADIVARVFGVIDVSICTLTGKEVETLSSAAADLAFSHIGSGKSFAVRAKRQQKVGLTSQELGEQIGSAVYDCIPGLRVDLEKPDYEIFVEVRDFGGLVYDSRIPAPGGLPFGTQGHVLVLLSSGIDSPVASWLAMKRGCEITHLHLDAGRWAGADVLAAATENHRKLSCWCPGQEIRMVIVKNEALFDEMQRLRIQPRYRCVICKRFMHRVAARIMGSEGQQALVTGENLGQVASQTLANLSVISEAVTVPVLRPLITYDKEETITLARRIGTFDTHPGDLACRAVPKMPATAALLVEIQACEQRMDMDAIIRTACENTRMVTARDGRIRDDDPEDTPPPDGDGMIGFTG